MPAAPEEIRRLEALADCAWPPAEARARDGWELRASGAAIGRRVNSVAPLSAGILPLEQKLADAEAFYRERGLPPTFKLTAAALPTGLDASLAGRGYRTAAPVLVLTLRPAAPGGPAPSLPEAPSAAWLEVNAGVPGHYAAAPEGFLALLGRIRRPIAFAAVPDEAAAAAVGMAVADGDWVGLFEIGTLPGRRRRGLATAVMDALLAWGVEHGARAAYLQVMEENGPARALYQRIGFTPAYAYWYRVAP